VLGVWAAMAGGVLAGLAITTGGLVAPIVAHAGYDFAALLWIRRQARRGTGGPA
jgi:membrane protease YdiL (CAAX protease family)